MTDRGETNWFRRNLVALVGFAIQLVVFGVYIGQQREINYQNREIISQQAKQIVSLEKSVQQHREDGDVHTNKEWRDSVTTLQNRFDSKLDALILGSNR